VGSGVAVGVGVAEGEGTGVKVWVGIGEGVREGGNVGKIVGDGRTATGVGDGEPFKPKTLDAAWHARVNISINKKRGRINRRGIVSSDELIKLLHVNFLCAAG
jgi:hypothetical protein